MIKLLALDKCDNLFIKPKDIKSGRMYGMITQKERILTSGSGTADKSLSRFLKHVSFQKF